MPIAIAIKHMLNTAMQLFLQPMILFSYEQLYKP